MEKPLLIDLDGVLRIGNNPAPYLKEFLDFIDSSKFKACILSNSTINSSKQIYDFFVSHSIDLKIPIITAIDAAHDYVKRKYKRVAAYTSDSVIDIFLDVLDFDNPEAVLIGDIGNKWNYQLMQTVFEYVRSGAELIAAHKNKFWNKQNVGIQLDAGPFIHAIEYATSSNSTLIGKPSPLYFGSALRKINFETTSKFIMLGDDLYSDMKGAKYLEAETILIFTGKTNPPVPAKYSRFIDHHVESLQEVVDLLFEKIDK